MWLSWQRIRLQCGRPGIDPWVGKFPWRRERLPTPVFWPGEFHRLYSPWGRKESDTTVTFTLLHCHLWPFDALSSPIPILLLNFPFPLKLSLLPFSLNISELFPLKLSFKHLISYILWTKADNVSCNQSLSQSNQRSSQISWGMLYSHSNLSIWFLWLISASSHAFQWRQAQRWMKTPDWENHKRFLELQLGNKPPNLLYDQTRQVHWAVLRALPKLELCMQKHNESIHDYYNWLQIIFK